MHEVKRVGVIGAGQMGGGIAQVAAVAGFDTVVSDTTDAAVERCKATHAKLLARAVEKGRMEQADADAASSRLTYAVGGAEADGLSGADIVIEAVVEDAAVKAKVFSTLAKRFADPVILATNTSSISITEIGAAASKAAAGADARVIGMHFFYPVPVMQLVEVINGLATEEEVTKRVIALAEAMGKTALPANDRAGFVSNRVLMPMINEAFYALMEGVAEPEAIDGIMKLGCNFPMGPLRLADFIGLDTCAHIMDVLAEGLNSERYRPCPLLRQLVTAGRLGDKTGRGIFDHQK
ncbi:MAG: 3-hydroxybutyryl-CoA dehydrogenase [Phycisphaerae bacterium]|nr:3-hydroxybutyryl-CoA dehydrogenase [Phycisphaerae bacterium]